MRVPYFLLFLLASSLAGGQYGEEPIDNGDDGGDGYDDGETNFDDEHADNYGGIQTPPRDEGGYKAKFLRPMPADEVEIVPKGGYQAKTKTVSRDETDYNPMPTPPPKRDDTEYKPKPTIPKSRDPTGYQQPKPILPKPSDQGNYQQPRPIQPKPSDQGNYQPKPTPELPRDQGNNYQQPRPTPLKPRDENKGGYKRPTPAKPRDQPGYQKMRPTPELPHDEETGYGDKPTPARPRDQDDYQRKSIPKDTGTGTGYQQPKPAPRDTMSKRKLTTAMPEGENPYGKKTGPIATDGPILPVPLDTGVEIMECSSSNRWIDVVGCYECEFQKCISSCHNELPPAFDICYNETALYRLRSLFESCLSDDYGTCHKLNEDMALAFLISNYDSEVADLNRREECLFKCATPKVMKCMDRCDPLPNPEDVDREPVVVCYNGLRGKISTMLRRFAGCIKKNESGYGQ